MPPPITLDSVLQRNLAERQRATQQLLAPQRNPAPVVVNNPISLLSSGLNQLQQGVGGQFTRAEDQRAQDSANQLAQLAAAEQAEQTQYNRSLDTFNQESSLAAQALAKSKFNQQQQTRALADAAQRARIESTKQNTALNKIKFGQQQKAQADEAARGGFNTNLDNRLDDLIAPLRAARANNQKIAQQAGQLGLVFDSNTNQYVDPTGSNTPAVLNNINSGLIQNDLTGTAAKTDLANQLNILEQAGRSTATPTDDLSLEDRNRLTEQLVNQISSTYQLDVNEQKALAGKMSGIEAKRAGALKAAGLDQSTELMNEMQTFKAMVDSGKALPNPIAEFVKNLPSEVEGRGYVQEQVKEVVQDFQGTKEGRNLPEGYLNVLLQKVLPTASVGQVGFLPDINNNEVDREQLLKRMQDESIRMQSALDKFDQRDNINQKYNAQAQAEQFRVFAKSGIIAK